MKNKNIVEFLSVEMQIDYSEDFLDKIKQLDDLEKRDRDGRTLLINAAIYNRLDVVKYLVQKGADINTCDSIGNTPLHAAVLGNNTKIVQYLLKNGAEVDAKNNFGNTPLWVASPTASLELFEILLLYGADPEIKNNYGVSILDTMSYFPEILRLLNSYLDKEQ